MKQNPQCVRCILHSQALRTICLWGVGPVPCDLMFVGEAPGQTEDFEGRPFVGQAGQLLDNILQRLGLARDTIYITNVLKCHPTGNKLPRQVDLSKCLEMCWPYLQEEIKRVKPKIVVVFGSVAMEFLTGLKIISRYEGRESPPLARGVRSFVSYHPAYVLRFPSREINIARTIFLAARAAGRKLSRPKDLKGVGIYDYEIRS